jgi:hypothetical protein
MPKSAEDAGGAAAPRVVGGIHDDSLASFISFIRYFEFIFRCGG